MPANLVEPGEEAAWDRAKRAAKKQYPDLGEDNDRYWKIVNHIFQNMKAMDAGAGLSKALRYVVVRRGD
jgi:hypothetical protein